MYSVMSFPQRPQSPPICTPCLQGSITETTGLSLAFRSEMTSPGLKFHLSTVPSIVESQVPKRVSGGALGVEGRWTKE